MKDFGRRYLWAYAVLLLSVAACFVKWNAYNMDGDGTAFLDISQALSEHHLPLAVNAYWNPGYPAVLAIGRKLTHATTWNELAVARWTNWFVLLFAMLGVLFFTTGMTRLRSVRGDGDHALPPYAVHLAGLTLLLMSAGRELPLEAIRSDTLLCALLLFAIGFVLRLQAGAGWWMYPALGATLGCAYLTKSFAFLPSALLLLSLFVVAVRKPGAGRASAMGGVGMAAVLFALLAGPYVLAISRQMGHLTPGESARLNYAFFIDGTPRWHEWHDHDLGHATGTFTHAEEVLGENPPEYSFKAHPYGTFPLWFDPAYWTAGLQPKVYLRGQVVRMARCAALFIRYLLARPEPLVLLAVLLLAGAALPHMRGIRLWGAPFLWGLLMLLIYFPVDLQDRYLAGPFYLMLLPLFAFLRCRRPAEKERVHFVSHVLVVLMSGLIAAQAVTVVLEQRRQLPAATRNLVGYSPEITQAAIGLRDLGVKPGDELACMGDRACYVDHYWARIPGAQILAEVQTPHERDPLEEWRGIPDPERITAPLKAMGLRAIVAKFPNSATKPEGWTQLGTSDFFAYRLDR